MSVCKGERKDECADEGEREVLTMQPSTHNSMHTLELTLTITISVATG